MDSDNNRTLKKTAMASALMALISTTWAFAQARVDASQTELSETKQRTTATSDNSLNRGATLGSGSSTGTGPSTDTAAQSMGSNQPNAPRNEMDRMNSVRPDNTRVNAEDRRRGAKTADDQSMASGDTDITRRIRRSLMEDKSITTAGKNIKVITNNGAVVLRGTVGSEAERHDVVSKAKGVAGAAKITDEIRVVSND